MIHDVLKMVEKKDLDGAIDELIRIAESSDNPKVVDLAMAETYHIEYLKTAPKEIAESVAQDVGKRLQELIDTRLGAKGGRAKTDSKLDPATQRTLRRSFAMLATDEHRLKKKGNVIDRGNLPGDFGPSKGSKPHRLELEDFK